MTLSVPSRSRRMGRGSPPAIMRWLIVRDADTGAEKHAFEHGSVVTVAFSPDGVVAAGDDAKKLTRCCAAFKFPVTSPHEASAQAPERLKKAVALNDGASIDRFGYRAYAQSLHAVIDDCSAPICVGLYAKWGSGKSFMIELLKRAFDLAREDPRTHGLVQWFEDRFDEPLLRGGRQGGAEGDKAEEQEKNAQKLKELQTMNARGTACACSHCALRCCSLVRSRSASPPAATPTWCRCGWRRWLRCSAKARAPPSLAATAGCSASRPRNGWRG